ncbi:MAG: transcriptional repressor [Candidatus Gracilibacteria bacterium]|nr:transcriptional repressor [Candidatus Gracilibacteria bacterium]
MNIENILKNSGNKITQERVDIYNFIKDISIFNANDLLNRFCDIGRASVFRTINLYVNLGLIRKIDLGDKIETYEFIDNSIHHEYIKCSSCGDVVSFECSDICKKIIKSAEKKGFLVQSHNVGVFGICEKCK